MYLLDVTPEESPKRQCTGMLQTHYSRHNKENIEMMDETTSDYVPYHLPSKTRGLAALKKKYSNGNVSLKECFYKYLLFIYCLPIHEFSVLIRPLF